VSGFYCDHNVLPFKYAENYRGFIAIGIFHKQKHVEKQTTANKQEFNLFKGEGVVAAEHKCHQSQLKLHEKREQQVKTYISIKFVYCLR
jgi:hypothetical protein